MERVILLCFIQYLITKFINQIYLLVNKVEKLITIFPLTIRLDLITKFMDRV